MSTPGGSKTRMLALGLAAAAAVAGAGWLGYSTAGSRWDVPALAGNAAPPGAASGSAPASSATQALAKKPRSPSSEPRAATSAQALSWPLWEFKLREPLPPREPPLTPPSWRLIGATQSGDLWQVVILRHGKPTPEFFRVGDSLPGGYLIEAISEEDVTLMYRRRRMIVAYLGT